LAIWLSSRCKRLPGDALIRYHTITIIKLPNSAIASTPHHTIIIKLPDQAIASTPSATTSHHVTPLPLSFVSFLQRAAALHLLCRHAMLLLTSINLSVANNQPG
jgi:hypothetical protein